MIPRDITVAAVQSPLFWEDKEANLHMFGEKIRAISTPLDLLALPEMFTTGFSMQPEKLAEKTDGPTLAWMQKQASNLNSVVTGSIIAEENGNYYNRLLWVRPDGTYVHYDKRHLFRFGNEEKHYTPGTQKLIVDLHGWKVCPLVCYDLRFPVWSRNRWKKNGTELIADYDLLVYVANWPERRGKVWKTLLMARAMENNSFVLGVNRIGNDIDNILHAGESAIIDFKGEYLKSAIISREEIISTKLSYQLLKEFRTSFPAGLDADNFSI
ncbi:MAG TPA: amidohydrolase [Bacteroidia bacterium]|nr:amidohydrolase [Bacteroidia bacterium]